MLHTLPYYKTIGCASRYARREGCDASLLPATMHALAPAARSLATSGRALHRCKPKLIGNTGGLCAASQHGRRLLLPYAASSIAGLNALWVCWQIAAVLVFNMVRTVLQHEQRCCCWGRVLPDQGYRLQVLCISDYRGFLRIADVICTR